MLKQKTTIKKPKKKLIELVKCFFTKSIIGFIAVIYIGIFSVNAQAQVWLPYPTRVCQGETFTQITASGQARSQTGTKAAYCRCTAGFSPKRQDICAGKVFTSSCENSAWSHYEQIDFGTSSGKVWSPNPATISKGSSFIQTSECNATRTAIGTKPPVAALNSFLSAAPSCSDLSTSEKNIMYIDDIGPYPLRSGRATFGGDDPNGLQDMLIVLGFGKHHRATINLLGVGTTNRGRESHELLEKIVLRSKVIIPAWPEDQIVSRITFYANCPQITPNKRLAVAIGGEWNKLSIALFNHGVSDKVEMAGLPSYNIRDCSDGGKFTVNGVTHARPDRCFYYDGSPFLAYLDVGAWLQHRNATHIFTDPLFRTPFLVGTDFSVGTLDKFYVDNFRNLLGGIRDEKNISLTSATYENFLKNQDPVNSRLRIADFLTVARFIWPNDLKRLHQKSFIHPKIKAAIATIQP